MTVSEIPRIEDGGGHWTVEPFDEASPEQLAQVRNGLAAMGFNETNVCARAGITSIYEIADLRMDGPLAQATDPLAVGIRLLIQSLPVPWKTVWSVLDPSLVEALTSIGILIAAAAKADAGVVPSAGSGECVATISLCPIAGLLIVADRHTELTHVANGAPGDTVYTAMTEEAAQFVRLLPRTQCGDYLELCSGTGIAALIAARQFAARSWGVDIADRSTRFAHFNAGLNGLDNTTMLTGDLYAPVAGLTFDAISAHPPYVPALATTMVYRDGGEDGEGITRRIIQGVPAHLRPGGSFFGSCMMTDRKGHPIEARIREMLGPLHAEFDVLVVQGRIFDVIGQLDIGVSVGMRTAEEADALRKLFANLEVERFVGIGFVVHRRVDPSRREAITVRRVLSPQTTGAHLLWYLEWTALSRELEADPRRLLAARPKRVEGTELRSRSLLRDDRWVVTHAALVSKVPFVAEGDCPPWFATLLGWCDGTVTAGEHLTRLRELDFVASDLSDADFGTMIRTLAEGGLIDLDVCPLPP